MDEYLSEKEQWEEVKGWLKINGPYLAAGVLLASAVLFGLRLWQDRAERLAHEASAKYAQALDAYGRGDASRGATLLTQLERDYAHSAYIDQLRLIAARMAAQSGAFAEAAQNLERVMQDSPDPQLQRLARLRLARVQLAQAKPDVALATLKAVDPGAFAPLYAEARGDILYAKGDRAGALKEYRMAIATKVAGSGADSSLLELKIKDLSTP